jgi:hypothetical protein
MTSDCLSDADFAATLADEADEKTRVHLASCAACASELRSLRDVADALAKPTADDATAAKGITERVMAQIAPAPAKILSFPLRSSLAALAAAAAVVLAMGWRSLRHDEWTARGGAVPSSDSLARKTGVNLYRLEGAHPERIQEGAHLSTHDAFVAGYRSVEAANHAYLACFVVDAANEVHWLYPAFANDEENPVSVALSSNSGETLLPSSVTFPDIAPGPARIVFLRTREPVSIKTLDATSHAELRAAPLVARFVGAAVDEVNVTFETPTR